MEKRRALWLVVPLLLVVTVFTLFACCCPGHRPGSASIAPATVPPIGQEEMPVPIEALPAPASRLARASISLHD